MSEKIKIEEQFGIRQTWIAKQLNAKSKEELLSICVGLHNRIHDAQLVLTSSWISEALQAADMMAKQKRGSGRSEHRENLVKLLRAGSLSVSGETIIQGVAPSDQAPSSEGIATSLRETELKDALAATKAARAADKAGFEAVIRDLREEVARLKGGAK